MNFIHYKHNQVSSYYHERPNSPTYLSVIIPVGTVHEVPARFGILHLVEHLICRETVKYDSLPKLKAEIAKRGIYLNAHTSLDNTRVHIGIPMSEDFGFAIRLLSEMLYSPSYTTETIEIEKNAIQSEIALRRSNPSSYIYTELYRKLFGLVSGYMPNFGNLKKLSGFTIEDVEAQFADIRALPLMVLGSGGVSMRDFKKGIDSIPKVKLSLGGRPKAIEHITNFASAEISHGERLCLGYIYAVAITDIDTICATKLITEYLGNYMFGILTQKLRDESGSSYYVAAEYNVCGKNGYISITTDIKQSEKAKVDKLVAVQINRLADGKIDIDRLEIVRKMIIKKSPTVLEQTASEVLVNIKLRSFIVNNGIDYYDYLDRLKCLSIDKVRQLAKQVFQQKDASQ